jgi:hypothetical protein
MSGLHAAGVVKIGVATKGYKFHPKFYSFKVGEKRVCFVGSANLTGHAFGGNIELVREYEDDGAAAAWFNRLWEASNAPTQEWLDEYDRRAAQTTRNSQAQLDQMAPPPAPMVPTPVSVPTPEAVVSAVIEADPFSSWRSYVAALKRADEYWQKKVLPHRSGSRKRRLRSEWRALRRRQMPESDPSIPRL